MIELEKIETKEDLAIILESLRDNFIERPSDWENQTIDRFLDAMASWLRSMENYRNNNNLDPLVQPSWSTLAEIIMAGKIYE